MLDGQGADEQLAGYHGSFPYYTANLVKRRKWLALARTIYERKNYHGLAYIEQLRELSLPFVPSGLFRRGKKLVGQPDWLNSPVFQPIAMIPSAFDTARSELQLGPVESIAELCLVMTQASNLTMLLHWEDRNSMAHGIEARVPFLDHRLVEFSIGLGDAHKIVHGDTKRVLRRAMANTLPPAILNRRDKLGFSTPEQTWFRGALRPAVQDGVEYTLSRFPDLLNAECTRLLVRQMLDGERPLDFTVWRIVNLGIWGRVFDVAL
jgi:asparagine synthase (glutamine-hydrolysing)